MLYRFYRLYYIRIFYITHMSIYVYIRKCYIYNYIVYLILSIYTMIYIYYIIYIIISYILLYAINIIYIIL